jgi:hypothetical protein
MSIDSNEPKSPPEGASQVEQLKEREAFVRTFIRKGVELTETLLRENEDLRDQVSSFRTDNARLRAQVASDDAIRDLIRSIERLESEKRSLLVKSTELEERRRRREGQYEEVERELNVLANLYVATDQLHTTLSVKEVMRHLCDMLRQFVGAEKFAIYILSENGRTAVPIGHEGLQDSEVRPLSIGEGPIGEACLTGMTSLRARMNSEPDTEEPLAVVPLVVDGRPVGAIAIRSLFEQKDNWTEVDQALFRLLGAHAGAALIAANLYEKSSSATVALSGLLERL